MLMPVLAVLFLGAAILFACLSRPPQPSPQIGVEMKDVETYVTKAIAEHQKAQEPEWEKIWQAQLVTSKRLKEIEAKQAEFGTLVTALDTKFEAVKGALAEQESQQCKRTHKRKTRDK
jgi:adenylosuccinate lyase